MTDASTENSGGTTPKSGSAFRNLGTTGLRVSCLSLGTAVTFGGQISDEMAEKIASHAYNSGINFFDTAEFYSDGGAERTLGKILKNKGWSAPTEQGLSRKRIIEGLLGSLDRLQLEYVDVVLIGRDPERKCTIEEVVRACTFVVNKGWAFYWGTSNWTQEDIMEAHAVARLFHLIPPSMEALEFNLFQREFHDLDLPELCSKIGLGLVSGAPLAQGILSGKYEDKLPEFSRAALCGQRSLRERILSKEGREQQNQVSQLSKLANRLGISVPQLSIAWCLKSIHISSVFLGAATVDQLQENLGALSAVSVLSNRVLAEIESILITDHQSENYL